MSKHNAYTSRFPSEKGASRRDSSHTPDSSSGLVETARMAAPRFLPLQCGYAPPGRAAAAERRPGIRQFGWHRFTTRAAVPADAGQVLAIVTADRRRQGHSAPTRQTGRDAIRQHNAKGPYEPSRAVAVLRVSAKPQKWFSLNFRAWAMEGHRNRDHERPWVMCSSKTCGSTGSKAC